MAGNKSDSSLQMEPSSRRLLLIVTALLMLVGAACYFHVYKVTPYTCLQCRAVLKKHLVCGLSFDSVAEGALSKKVFSLDSTHQHKWRWSGSYTFRSLMEYGHSCGSRHPIWDVPTNVQERYSQLVTPAEMDDMLKRIDAPNKKQAEAATQEMVERVLDVM